MAQGPDGALYLSDGTNDVVYRNTYTGAQEADAGALEPTNAAGADIGVSGGNGASAPADSAGSLATEIVSAEGSLDVSSPAFEDGEPIPQAYAAEQQNVLPPLDWSEGPDGTQSYAVMVEDPDVGQDSPFVHWLIYNIPADVADLREGVPGAPQLPLPEGTKQGANDHGSTGWYGMKPPAGAPAHD